MNMEMNGKKIKAVYWPATENAHGQCITAGEHGDIHLSATYHGDHDQFWIIQSRDGKEFCRHNPRFVETIYWAD